MRWDYSISDSIKTYHNNFWDAYIGDETCKYPEIGHYLWNYVNCVIELGTSSMIK